MGYAPENAPRYFRVAIDVGVDGVEPGVRMTKDGEVVVIHDFMIDRATLLRAYPQRRLRVIMLMLR